VQESSSLDSQAQKRVAVVVGILLPGQDRDKLEEDLDELESLLKTLGISCNGRVTQRRQKLTPQCLLGTGKAEQLREIAEAVEANLVVFDRQLSGPQVRNLEKLTCCEVMDRQGVILEIFAKHAKTNQAKTQVEIARLEYLLPRLTGAWTHFQRQTGGSVRARGMGEKQIEIDRRRAKERIARLKGHLQQIAKEKDLQRKARRKELKVAIVGYTNSGKTTLMNALTKAELLAKDALFATLDANVKMLDPETRPRILISDTVGFIRNLPHGLVDSFRSTLDEVLEADLLLHVIDSSYARYEDHIQTTQEVLQEIGAGWIPVIKVFNKTDNLDDPFLPRILRQAYPGSICVSAYNPEDAVRLCDHIYEFFAQNFVRASLKIPVTDQTVVSMVFDTCKIITSDYSEDDVVSFDIRTTRSALAKLQEFVVV